MDARRKFAAAVALRLAPIQLRRTGSFLPADCVIVVALATAAGESELGREAPNRLPEISNQQSLVGYLGRLVPHNARSRQCKRAGHLPFALRQTYPNHDGTCLHMILASCVCALAVIARKLRYFYAIHRSTSLLIAAAQALLV